MPTFASMKRNLKTLVMGQLRDEEIGVLLNKALEEEIETWQWESLFQTGVIWGIPDNVQGVVNVTNGQARVLGQGTNFPTTFPNYAPPENWVIVLGSQYMPMDVKRFVSATELHLKEPWGDVTQSNVNFNLRPQFYSVPGAAEIQIVRQILPVLPVSRFMLSLMDPARLAGTATPSVAFAPAGFDLGGNKRMELWLRPGGIQCFTIEFRLRFEPMASDNDWPRIPINVLEPKAAAYCYASLYASTGNPQWADLMRDAKETYAMQYSKAIRDDIERQSKPNGGVYQPGYEAITGIDFGGPPGSGNG